jgi:photosystem II stability/assembly factor-like uncharacterized protein
VATGYLLDTRGDLWKTTNRGRSWDEIECLGAWRPTTVAFADAKHGFALVTPTSRRYDLGANLLRTNDAGKSWHPQFVSGGPAEGLEVAGSTSYLLVGDSVLYASSTGGDVGAAPKLVLSAKPRAVTRPSTVTIGGTLKPAHGGEDVMVSRYMAGVWSVKHTTVASNGTFSTRWGVAKTAIFVAQAYGDADRASAGTSALTVKLLRKHSR